MNIFILDENPQIAAQYMCNAHVVKMILETAQLLSSAAKFHGSQEPFLYKETHKNHPCTLWAKETKANFLWLKIHGLALSNEYSYRYGKIHKSQTIIEKVNINNIPNGNLTKFAIVMPEKYKKENAVDSYRSYYLGEKRSFAKWTRREPPDWWIV